MTFGQLSDVVGVVFAVVAVVAMAAIGLIRGVNRTLRDELDDLHAEARDLRLRRGGAITPQDVIAARDRQAAPTVVGVIDPTDNDRLVLPIPDKWRCPECDGPAGGCDHFEWVEVTDYGDAEPRYLPGLRKPCPHGDTIDVDSPEGSGHVVARLCLDCDTQLGAPTTWPT